MVNTANIPMFTQYGVLDQSTNDTFLSGVGECYYGTDAQNNGTEVYIESDDGLVYPSGRPYGPWTQWQRFPGSTTA